MELNALSIVFPGGTNIAQGKKTIEVRSWLPPLDFHGDLVIVENKKFLREDGDVDPEGVAVAIVKIKLTREYLESDIPAAMASRWEPGYYSWELMDVRPINPPGPVLAARGIYKIELDPNFMEQI
ncbi:ASCH domain-containing protein [Bacteriovorax sp. PP10]|uniref:ASCH domain-containing protein n=1 Tax=Bacteriovorax antarcticus TaxID=3088717 RepID=A0ABU5VWN2_9BACT|nr:ASCH domain-containing protein [Bacteriovorax sp. PP10]MEA9357002.1 ASCH domain-containing protein [Bacteriovorax sp. PP10]